MPITTQVISAPKYLRISLIIFFCKKIKKKKKKKPPYESVYAFIFFIKTIYWLPFSLLLPTTGVPFINAARDKK